MRYDEVKRYLRGVAVGLLTPFDESRNVDHDTLARNAERLYERNVRTFLANANISEYHSLSQAEREACARTAVEALPDDVCVLVGVGGNTPDAIDLIETYAEIGVDAMMIMPPDHSFRHERGILDYVEKLGTASDRPVVPYLKGYEPSLEFAVSLTEIADVVGIKYALADTHFLARAVKAGSDDVVWVDGLAEPYAPEFYLAGAEGFSAGVSNFEPSVGLALFDALEAGDYERAAQIRDICLPYMEFRDTVGRDNTITGANSIPAVKKGYDLAGLDGSGGRVREPLVELSAADERRAEELYDRLRDDMDRLLH